MSGNTKRIILLVATVAGFLFASAATAQTRDENADRCKGDDPDLAIGACTALIQSGQETNEGLAIAYNNRGSAYTNKGDYDHALSDLNEAITLNPNYATAFYNRAIVYNDGKHDTQRAIQDYDQAIQFKPDYDSAYNNRGSAYDDLGQYDRAIQDYNEALRLKPDFGMAFTNRGVAYRHLHQYAKALPDYDEALRLDSSKPNRWANRCWAKLLLHRLPDALKDCEASLKRKRCFDPTCFVGV